MASSTGGSIRHRADGRWEARNIDARGRRASRYARTKRDAQQLLRIALTESAMSIKALPASLKVRTYPAGWLAQSVSVRNRPRTVDSYSETPRARPEAWPRSEERRVTGRCSRAAS